jgi:hypothetical protein
MHQPKCVRFVTITLEFLEKVWDMHQSKSGRFVTIALKFLDKYGM